MGYRISVSVTPSNTPSKTPTNTPTITNCPTRTPVITQTATSTIASTPTQTSSPTSTPQITQTATPTLSSTNTPTPSITQTNTPSNTATNTPTSTIGSTPTQTSTNTPTPTLNSICPEQITISSSTYPSYNGTYYRLYQGYAGGFNYALWDRYANPDAWVFDTTDTQGFYSIVYGRQVGSTYYTIFAYEGTGVPGLRYVVTSNTDYVVNFTTGFGLGVVLDNLPNAVGNVKYPSPGFTGINNFFVEYPPICPTATPTPTVSTTPSLSPTQTSTNTATPTNTSTPTQTSTQTSTPPVITPTNTSTPTNTNTGTPTNTPTNTSTNTPTNTSTPTNTPSPSQTESCLCFSSMTVSVTTAGNITFKDCNNIDRTWDVLTGEQTVGPDPEWCIQKNTNGGTAEYTILSYNDCCSSTPPPSSTPTSTPTSTPPVVTPTTTSTPTQTSTSTPTNTPTMTNTPTIVEYCNYVSVDTQASLDIDISDVTVSGVSVSYISGTNFTIEPSEPTGYFGSNISGNSVTVRVYYSSSITGQNITVMDCTETIYCCDTNVGPTFCEFTLDLSCGCSWTITASDGACV